MHGIVFCIYRWFQCTECPRQLFPNEVLATARLNVVRKDVRGVKCCMKGPLANIKIKIARLHLAAVAI